jgi:putative GTP pyrophosphokinase
MKQTNKIVKEIVERWEIDEPKYSNLESIIYEFLKESIFVLELYPTIYTRVKQLISLIKTSLKKDKKYDDIHDKLGLRVVVQFKSELEVIKKFIESNFIVVSYERKSDKIKYDQLDYLSDHYEAKINPSINDFKQLDDYADFIFEIQVRTLCQHTWADIEHSLMYKQDIDLEESYKRRIFRLISLLEICDDEFDTINNDIVKLPEYTIYYLLKTLEGKFYKYAKRSFNKEISIDVITLLSQVYKKEEITNVISDLKKYIEENSERISQIFLERKEQMKTNIFFSQPEIFFIWFLVDKKQYDLVNLWKQYYDIDDLKELSIWWGNPINID